MLINLFYFYHFIIIILIFDQKNFLLIYFNLITHQILLIIVRFINRNLKK